MKLYRCKSPTNALCPCGKVARALDAAGLEALFPSARIIERVA